MSKRPAGAADAGHASGVTDKNERPADVMTLGVRKIDFKDTVTKNPSKTAHCDWR